jgi:hypothetical protein
MTCKRVHSLNMFTVGDLNKYCSDLQGTHIMRRFDKVFHSAETMYICLF